MFRLHHLKPDFLFWILLCLIMGLLTVLYLSMGLAASNGTLLMPLDDTYIHFQYARQMAQGDPYVYNPGDAPTSGGTSFLYPILLAIGYAIGFTNLHLAYWAAGIGAISLLISAWLVYRLLMGKSDTRLPAMLFSLAFLLTGAFIWAALSGMETALFMLVVLLALYTYQQGMQWGSVLAGVLLVLVRPEGAIMAITLVIAWLWRFRHHRRGWVWLMLPLLAIGLQPLVNGLITGSLSASGNQAKSHLYNVAVPMVERIETVLEFWWRLWRELITGGSEATFIPALLVILALAMIPVSLWESWRQKQITPGLLAGIWIVLVSGAIATLDTAFWQFKRYQLPLMALMFPLAGWFLFWLTDVLRRDGWIRTATGLLLIILILPSSLNYAGIYFNNIDVLRRQQIAMARWVDAHLPPEARVGVHDVGVMRYVGNRRTYDVVGLTTPGTAAAWRQGPGAIYETMVNHPLRPDYFAIYPDVLGIPYLWEAGVMGESLRRFETPLPEYTVVSATSTQIVSQPDWSDDDQADMPRQTTTLEYLTGAILLDQINVADLADEAAVNYVWWNVATPEGYATQVRNLPHAACVLDVCRVTDGNRVINGGERFDLPPLPNDQRDYLVIGRYHAAAPVTLKLGCDDDPPAVYAIPDLPGSWIEIAFRVDGDADQFCLTADGDYFPAGYWIYGGSDGDESVAVDDAAGIFIEPNQPENQITLIDYDLQQTDEALILSLVWQTDNDLHGNSKIFVHLYDDPAQEPDAQIVRYPLMVLPPANWLPGVIHDQVRLPLDGVPPGEYTLAIGFFEVGNGQRYPILPGSGLADQDRLVLDTIVIPAR